jgi:O-antigen ligase
MEQPAFQPLAGSVEQPVAKQGLGAPVLALGLLLSSYFYCLPLGRFAALSLATDFRIYDFAFFGFLFFFGRGLWVKLRTLFAERRSFVFWSGLLLAMVWLSLVTMVQTGGGGAGLFLPGVIRSIRFTYYFVTAAFVLILVDTPRRFRFLLGVLFVNIAIQGGLSFAQGQGWLPSFWPSYWLRIYGFQPVGTLSPHHKQIGVVMLLGVALSLTLLRAQLRGWAKALVLVAMSLMLASTVLAVSRTSWMGLFGLVGGFLLMNRGRSRAILIPVALGLVALFFVSGNAIQESLTESVDRVFFDRLERFGFEGIAGQRMQVYDNYPDAIVEHPWILVIGTGFQNISTMVGVGGAHNNYFQALFELGFLGFVVYMMMLVTVLRNLKAVVDHPPGPLEEIVARDAWAAFAGVLVTMLVGESLWGQGSMFTLTGQIMAYMALAIAPLYWKPEIKEAEVEHAAARPGLRA